MPTVRPRSHHWTIATLILLALAGPTRARPAASVDQVMVAIVAVESSGQPWAIHDNATGATYALADEAAAIAKARELLALGRDIDIGLYQINSGHLNRGGITLANIFNPEVNANLGRTIFMEFYAAAKSLYGDTDLALERAIGAYNGGNVRVANPGYVDKVLRKLGAVAPPMVESNSRVMNEPEPTPGKVKAELLGDWPDLGTDLLAMVLLIILLVFLGTSLAVRLLIVTVARLAQRTVGTTMRVPPRIAS